MRILFLTPFLPDRSAPHGGGIYLATLAHALARNAAVGLLAQLRPAEADRLAADPSPWQWVDSVPFRERPAGPGRTAHRLRMLWHWRRMPLLAAKHWDPRFPPKIALALRDFRPDVVFVELAQMAQYLPFLRDVPTILTDHEAGCPANTTTGLGSWGDRRDVRLWHRFVRKFYPQASLVQTVTKEDADVLALAVGRPVVVRPPTFAVAEHPVQPAAAPPRALFLGDYSHCPNPEAATFLVRSLFPLLRARQPQTELWFAGPNTDRLQHLANEPGVRIVGFAPDLHALLGQVRLLLAPLFSGGGFRVKSLAALAHGLPVVTNELGARGCTAPAPARTIAEGPAALAEAALALLQSPDQAARAGAAAYAWAQQNLTGDAVAKAQLARAADLLATRRATPRDTAAS